jgi:hypothetical protein
MDIFPCHLDDELESAAGEGTSPAARRSDGATIAMPTYPEARFKKVLRSEAKPSLTRGESSSAIKATRGTPCLFRAMDCPASGLLWREKREGKLACKMQGKPRGIAHLQSSSIARLC